MSREPPEFPADPASRSFIITIYANEILFRCSCALQAINECYLGFQTRETPSSIIRRAMEAVGHAMAIRRIVTAHTERQKNKKRAQGRVEMLTAVFPDLPIEPEGLRKVRDSLEHFEERLDEWAVSSQQLIYIDLNIGDIQISPPGLRAFRNFDYEGLHFWDDCVVLDDIREWVIGMARAIFRSYPEPSILEAKIRSLRLPLKELGDLDRI